MSRSPSRTLKLTYLGDASQLSSTTRGAANDMSSLGDRVRNVGKVLAVGFAAVGAAGLAMGKKLFDAFEEVSTANARVEQVVNSMGNFEGQLESTTQRIIAQAEATARLTGVDRNLIKESQALLLTFDSVNQTAGEAGGVFDRATQAAIDLAAAGFGSATSNAQSLGRALEDPLRGLTSLTRQGVTFTEEQRALIASLIESNRTLEAQDIILQAIERQVGGVAEATANGSARMSQAFGILTEQIALALGPAFEFLAEKAIEFIEKAMVWWNENGDEVIEKFRRFAARVKESWEEFRTFFSIVGDELRTRGTFDRLAGKFDDVRESAERAGESINRLLNALVGGSAETRAGRFAWLIDNYYSKPLELAFAQAENFFNIIDRIASAAANLAEFFQGRGQLSMAGGDFTIPDNFVPGQIAPPTRPTTTNNITVQGAIDPEGTARTIIRTLEESRARVGTVTGRLSGTGL